MALIPATETEETGKWKEKRKVFLDDSVSPNRVIDAVVVVDEDGNQLIPSLTSPATNLEGLGDIAVGTSEVEIVVSGTPRSIRIQADEDNTGIIFIGKTGILSDKTNDYVRLHAGDEHTMDYNDVSNGVFAISDTAGQKINAGALLL